jgi:hypothetical protein
MKTLLPTLIFALIAAAAACGTSSGGPVPTGPGLNFVTDGGPDAGSHDAGGTENQPDAGSMLTCSEILDCINACANGDQTCAQNCYNEGTSNAQHLFEAANQCVVTACPSTGACSNPSSTTCQNCENNAVMGTCASQVNACANDTGGTMTGGTDGGTNCSGIITCGNACSNQTCLQNCVSEGTQAAQTDYIALNNCLVSACPDTNNGPCMTQGNSCTQCLSSAQMSGGSCYSDLQTCVNQR